MKRSFIVSGIFAFLSLGIFSYAHAATPVVSFTQDVDLGPVASDTIEISATDLDGDITALDYGFSPDAVCDAGDTFPNTFTHATPFAITSEVNNGSYVCVRTTDTSDGLNYFLSGNVLNIDITAPVFDELLVRTQDGGGTPLPAHIDGNRYAKAGDAIRFRLKFTTDDNVGTGSFINFTIGGVAGQTPDYATTNQTSAINKKYDILPGDNGMLVLTGHTVTDIAGNGLTGFSTVLSETFIIDTTLPVITYTDDVAAGPVTSDDVTITVTDVNLDTTTLEYGFSPDAVCDGTDTFGNSFTSGVPFSIITEANNGSFICAKGVDKAGNEAFLLSSNPLNIDVTAPVFSNIGVTSDNVFDPNYGNASSTLTFTLTLASPDSFAGPGAGTGRITFDIGATTGITADLNEVASAAPGSVYTATYPLAGENGNITITDIDFQDFVGQDMTGFSAGAPTPTVIIDTTFPSLDTVARVSSNTNPAWAKADDTITYTLGFDEDVQLDTLNSSTTATNVTTLTQEFDLPSFGLSDQIIFTVVNGDNGTVSISSADFDIVDRAGNVTNVMEGDINALVLSLLQSDTTKPTLPLISISSNNALDTTLAKTNDTITVTFTTADNLSTNIVLGSAGNQHILNSPITGSSVSGVGPGQTISRFTDGTEDSEVVVPFQIRVKDEAGNRRTVTAVTDGSEVKFDRTDPVVANVSISATSQDATAFLGDLPTYYARMGDDLHLHFDLCDYVDSQNNPPTGTFFGAPVVMTDGGLVGGACTTGDGNPSTFRRWEINQSGIDGPEGTILFDIDAKDNAGNVLVSVTGTTDGTKVIFDKTKPTLPTTILDLLGPETPQFKHIRNASYAWSGHMDPNPGADLISELFSVDILFDHPSNGTNESAVVLEPTNTYTPATPVPHIDPYTFHVSTVTDKAGNKADPEAIYTQRYTVGISGQVTDQNGTPISGASVQLVSAFGEVCNFLNTEICTALTDTNGFYGEVLLAPNQEYSMSTFERRHYMDKFLLDFGITDVTRNVTLQNILDPHQIQTGGTMVIVQTKGTFIGPDGKPQPTILFVNVLSGEVTVTPNGSGGFIVTSRSRILSVTSNNPDVEIVNNAPNTFTVKGAGTFTGTQSFDNRPSTLAGPSITSNIGSSSFGSGASRFGVTGSISGNGKSGLRQPGMTRDEFRAMMQHGWMTYAESLAHAARMNEGRDSKILYYVNDLGHKVFQGYLPGKLPLAKVGKRYTNHVAYRGGPIRNLVRVDIPEENEIPSDETLTAFEERFAVIKDTYQARKPEEETVIAAAPEIKDEKEELYASVMNARVQRLVYNDSYKFRPEHKSYTAESRIERNGADNFKMRIGGKSVSVGTAIGQ